MRGSAPREEAKNAWELLSSPLIKCDGPPPRPLLASSVSSPRSNFRRHLECGGNDAALESERLIHGARSTQSASERSILRQSNVDAISYGFQSGVLPPRSINRHPKSQRFGIRSRPLDLLRDLEFHGAGLMSHVRMPHDVLVILHCGVRGFGSSLDIEPEDHSPPSPGAVRRSHRARRVENDMILSQIGHILTPCPRRVGPIPRAARRGRPPCG